MPYCLSFESFVSLLEKAHARGARERLNPHYLPQDVACPTGKRAGVNTYAGNISYMSTILNEKARAYGLHDVRTKHLHGSKPAAAAVAARSGVGSSAPNSELGSGSALARTMLKLCKLAEPEYAALNLPPSAWCRHGVQ